MTEDCSAAIDTFNGVVQCHREDGRDHGGPHYHDVIEDGRLQSRIEWWDHESGYGSIPAKRLVQGSWERMNRRHEWPKGHGNE